MPSTVAVRVASVLALAAFAHCATAADVLARPGTGVAPANATVSGAAEEIRTLELAANAAIARGDVAVVDRMTRGDFTFITTRGLIVTKAGMLKGLAEGAFKYEYRQIYDLSIRVYGDAAVVTGRSLHTGQEDGKDASDAYRYTRVYVRESGHWLAVVWQATREVDLLRD